MTENKTKSIIEVKNLTKYYGDFPAIEDLTFNVRKGEILGFLGPNAAGKTTTMRILTGFMPPTSGTVTINDYDIVEHSLEIRKQMGYLPETVPLYMDMSVHKYLEFMGILRGMNRRNIQRRIGEVIDVCHLGDYRRSLIGKLSKGFRQRVGIAQAILHEPEVLVLDEPTIGIDPIQVAETRQLIKGLAGAHTIILSTHILPEVSMVCGRVLIIHEGQVIAEDHPDNLADRLQGGERTEVEVLGPKAKVMNSLQSLNGVENIKMIVENDRTIYSIQSRRGSDLRQDIARTVVSNGWGLLRLQVMAMTLEEIFLKLTVNEEV